MNKSSGLQRRHFLAASTLQLMAFAKSKEISGGFTGVNPERGHALREGKAWPAPSVTRTTGVLIAGGRVAGPESIGWRLVSFRFDSQLIGLQGA